MKKTYWLFESASFHDTFFLAFLQQGNSPQAMALARGIQQKLNELQDKCNRAVMGTERSGIRRPAPTVAGKLEQAQRWLANPALDDKGLGKGMSG